MPFCPCVWCTQGAGTWVGLRTASKSTGTAKESRGLIQSSQPLCLSQPHWETASHVSPEATSLTGKGPSEPLLAIGHAGLAP